jgi:hypothetical protein
LYQRQREKVSSISTLLLRFKIDVVLDSLMILPPRKPLPRALPSSFISRATHAFRDDRLLDGAKVSWPKHHILTEVSEARNDDASDEKSIHERANEKQETELVDDAERVRDHRPETYHHDDSSTRN